MWAGFSADLKVKHNLQMENELQIYKCKLQLK